MILEIHEWIFHPPMESLTIGKHLQFLSHFTQRKLCVPDSEKRTEKEVTFGKYTARRGELKVIVQCSGGACRDWVS